jgi:hypothetical protein
MNEEPKSEIRIPKSEFRNGAASVGFRISDFGFLFVLLLPLIAGCGGQGKVSGRVLYNGKPVPGGWVTFRPAEGKANTVNARLDANGYYEATLPVGMVGIAVDNRDLQPQLQERASGPTLPPGLQLPTGAKRAPQTPLPAEQAPEPLPGDYVPIPARYYDVDTSGLTYMVKRGAQTHDIELK